LFLCVFFFFQAEDGIRDRNVTGVQTCALPISNSSCAQAGAVPLDWTGSVILDSERHPYLDSGVTYRFSFVLTSGPGYRIRVTQDPFPTPILHIASVSPSANMDVWIFTPSSCGKYWVELLNIGFGSQPSGYHVLIAALMS